MTIDMWVIAVQWLRFASGPTLDGVKDKKTVSMKRMSGW
jgi:hypothetical protein